MLTEKEERNEFEKRLVIINNFLYNILITGGCGYDLKEILVDIIFGRITTEDRAIEIWTERGWYLI